MRGRRIPISARDGSASIRFSARQLGRSLGLEVSNQTESGNY